MVSLQSVRKKYLSEVKPVSTGFTVSSSASVGTSPTSVGSSSKFGFSSKTFSTLLEKAKKVAPVCGRSVDRAVWCLFLVGEWRGIPPYSFPDDLKPVLLNLIAKDKVPVKVKAYLKSLGILKGIDIKHESPTKEVAEELRKIVEEGRKGSVSKVAALIAKLQKRFKGKLPEVLSKAELEVRVFSKGTSDVVKALREMVIKGASPETVAQELITKLRAPKMAVKPQVVTQAKEAVKTSIDESSLQAQVMQRLKKSLASGIR